MEKERIQAHFSFPSGVVAIAAMWIHNNQHLGCYPVFAPVQVVESLIDDLRQQQDMLQAIELFHPFAKVFKGFRQSQMFILISFNLSLLCLLRANRKFHRKLKLRLTTPVAVPYRPQKLFLGRSQRNFLSSFQAIQVMCAHMHTRGWLWKKEAVQ